MTKRQPSPLNVQQALFELTAELSRSSSAVATSAGSDEALDATFETLARAPQAHHRELEETIWSRWCHHSQADARARMARGIGLLSRGELSDALAIFDDLVTSHPEWPEAWNKRATVFYLLGRDGDSVSDIAQVLRREPRHFGALGGLAQIAMRNANPDAARIALQRLLEINPRAEGIAEAVAALAEQAPRVVH